MDMYENAHFTEDGKSISEPKRCHCIDETIQPFQVTNTNVILWDHQPCGLSQIVHLSQYRKPLIKIKNKIIGSGSGMVAKMKQGIVHSVVTGTLSYNTESVDGGLCIFINKFQENNEDQFAAPVVFAKNTNISSTKEEEYHSDLKSISEQCHCNLPIDPSKFVKVRLKCLTKGLSCQIMVEMISVATKFIVTPVSPIPTIMTALSNRLSALSSRKEMQTGFIIMDKCRKLVLLLENDPKVFEFPIIGLWVSGTPSVVHPFVWISFLRYISCQQYTNRLCLPPQPFLLVLYSCNCEFPEYYDCITSNGSQNLSYDLYTGCAVASVSRFPTLDVTVTDIELSKVADKTKWKYFINAENQLLSGRQLLQSTAQNFIISNVDDMPQISPVPQPVKMIEPRPLVPDLSLAASRNGDSIAPYSMGDKTALCFNDCESNTDYSNKLCTKELACPKECVHHEPVCSYNRDLSFMPGSVINKDFFEEEINAVLPIMNSARITDSANFQNNVEGNCEVNSHLECSYNLFECNNGRLSADRQISEDLPVINHSTPVFVVHENAPTTTNSKTLPAQPTRIPKLKNKQIKNYPSRTSSKPFPVANKEQKESGVDKSVLLASASTMTSIVWPPPSNVETHGTRDNAKIIYVDEVLQTDDLNFDKNLYPHTDEKMAQKAAVECVATQTSICERKPTEVKEFHCMGCCQCCVNKCKVRRNCLKTSVSCTGCHYEDNNEVQCSSTSGINSSVIEDAFNNVFNSDCSTNEEEDNMFLGESASTTTNKVKRNLHEISGTDVRHAEQNENEYGIGNHTSCDNSDEEDFRLFNIIQGHASDTIDKRTVQLKHTLPPPPTRNANRIKDTSRPPNTLFHSTSETTKKLNSYALKYIEPEVLSEFANSYRLDSINERATNDDDGRDEYIYGQKRIYLLEDKTFKPSPRNVLASNFSVATNKHLEKYVFS